MKNVFITMLMFTFQLYGFTQVTALKGRHKPGSETEKYFSFNPFGLAEPQIATGFGFGNRFTERSEYFTELSYITKTPFYTTKPNKLNGYRLLLQYRYNILESSIPGLGLRSGRLKGRSNGNSFIAAEFRLKGYNFSSTNTFIKTNPADTLQNYLYEAGAVSVGGAIILGRSYNLSNDGNWKLDLTAGVGGKAKKVKYKNVPQDYQSLTKKGGFGLAPPSIDETIGLPYFPLCIRIRYIIN